MTSKPKLETVAREAGVSLATVSQVMRGKGRISESTRNRVLQAANRLNYVPDGRAASMRSGVSKEIGMAIHDIANSFNAEVISGVSAYLDTEGYLVSVLDAQDDARIQRRQLEAFIGNSRGGLIWVPAKNTPYSSIELLQTQQIPTVSFLRAWPGDLFDHIGIKNADAIGTAVDYLSGLGHRHIAYLGGEANFGVRIERLEGFRRAMRRIGSAPPLVWDSRDDKVSGKTAMRALLTAHPQISAVVCNGDMTAIGALAACAEMNRRIGEDISIIGFDGTQDAQIATPALTTLSINPNEMGRKLAQVLLNRIANPDLPITASLVAADLVVRKSTGPAQPRLLST
ncbi:LacI family transcriptional regulator [Planktomarina sp.]|nr:LacI family transcriptional regulator [Planktomarina sp.]